MLFQTESADITATSPFRPKDPTFRSATLIFPDCQDQGIADSARN